METLPGMSEREIYEGMTPESLLQQIENDLTKIESIRERIRLASDVLAGAYGIEIDPILEERDKNYGKT